MTIGILQPQLPYRWRIRVPSLGEEQHNRFTCQAESIGIDYKTRMLTLTLVQNAHDTLLHEAIINLVNRSSIVLHVDSLNGVDSVPDYILEFECELVSHDFKLDYTQTDGTANHTLVFEYTTMTPYNQKEQQEEELEVA